MNTSEIVDITIIDEMTIMVNGKKKRKKKKKKKKVKGGLSETIMETSIIEEHPDNVLKIDPNPP